MDFAEGRLVLSEDMVVKQAATIVNVKRENDCYKVQASVHLNPSLFQNRSTGRCLVASPWDVPWPGTKDFRL